MIVVPPAALQPAGCQRVVRGLRSQGPLVVAREDAGTGVGPEGDMALSISGSEEEGMGVSSARDKR